MTAFDFSAFDQISNEIQKEIKEAKSTGRVTANSAQKINAEFLKLEQQTQDIFNAIAGFAYKQCRVEVTHPDKVGKPQLDFFKAKSPKSSGDDFTAEKIKANYYFRCTVVALCAQNKGKISVADLACLWQAFQLGYYTDSHNRSTAAVAGKLQFNLVRPVIVKGEYLEIPGLEIDDFGTRYLPMGNKMIAEWKSKLTNTNQLPTTNKSRSVKSKIAA